MMIEGFNMPMPCFKICQTIFLISNIPKTNASSRKTLHVYPFENINRKGNTENKNFKPTGD